MIADLYIALVVWCPVSFNLSESGLIADERNVCGAYVSFFSVNKTSSIGADNCDVIL